MGSPVTRQNGGIRRAQTSPDVIWDVNNNKGIPVASGTYLIHVRDEDSGEETIVKWFGVHRKFDPTGL